MSNGDRKTVMSSGLSWTAIGIVLAVSLAVGAPVIGLGINISRELGQISTTLERVATDLTDNKSDHKEFRQRILDHETRISVIEADDESR